MSYMKEVCYFAVAVNTRVTCTVLYSELRKMFGMVLAEQLAMLQHRCCLSFGAM